MSVLQQWQPNERKNIVILRALQLGDMLCSVPAFRALRGTFPNAYITLVGLPWAGTFVERFSTYLDDFVEFPGFPGFPEQRPNIAEFPYFLVEMQRLNFDLAIQMQGSVGSANSLISLWDAKSYAGFYTSGKYCPDEEQFLEYPEHESEVWRHLRLMEFLGIPLQGDELEFPIFDQDLKVFFQLEKDYALQTNYVCIHPGARALSRRWEAKNFAEVADGLAAQGYQIVLTGTLDEINITKEVAEHMQTPAINLAGKTQLGTLAALVSQASLLLSNDAEISHLAAALKAPSVILFSDSDPYRWAPQDQHLHRIITQAGSLSAADVLEITEQHLRDLQQPVPINSELMNRLVSK
jgi:ADP-heptose:LPS heptosyltransferase